MKQLLKISFFAVLTISLFAFGACDKLKTLVIGYPSTFTVDVPVSAAAGTQTSSKKDVANPVTTFLKDKGIDIAAVDAIELESMEAVIPSTSTLDFSDVSAVSFSFNGIVKAKLANPLAGKSAILPIAVPSVKADFLADKISYDFNVTTNKATPATTVTVKYKLNITYKL